MTSPIVEKARLITQASSKQTYYTIRLLVDKDLVDDCFCAYAYLRWVDDVIDISSRDRKERVSFIHRQQSLVERLYRNELPEGLVEEEEFVAKLIQHERSGKSGLRSFINNFLAILEFDAERKNRLIGQNDLDWYSSYLAKSVTDGIQYFICNCFPYPASEYQYLAAEGAHVTHMLRDLVGDISEGYINIPGEYIQVNNVVEIDTNDPIIQEWVRDRVSLARRYFKEGKRYLEDLEILRCKIAGYWYCAQFEFILDRIEADNFKLRPEYKGRQKISTWLKMAWIAVSISIQHLTKDGLWRSWKRPAVRV